MKKSTILIFIVALTLSGQSCSKEFVQDCKDAISGVNIKVEPPKGCDENEFL